MIITPSTLAGLRTGFQTAFNNAFNAAASFWEKVAMLVPSRTAVETYAWLADLADLREWIGDRVINNVKESGYTLKNIPFEKTIGVKRDNVEDDQIGLYANRFAMMGHSARTHPDKQVFKLLKNGFSGKCYDDQYFFDTDHPVLVDGVPVSVSNFADGANTPWYLLCTTMPVRPLIFQKRKDYTFVAMDRETDENVFKRGEYLYGVDARVNAGYGLWQLAFGSKLDLTADNYRLPTNTERVAYSNSLFAQKGKKRIPKENVFAEQVALGKKIHLGFSEGYFMDGDLFISSDKSKPSYRENFKDLIEAARPSDYQLITQAALRPAQSDATDVEELAPVTGDEPEERPDDEARDTGQAEDAGETAADAPLGSNSEPS